METSCRVVSIIAQDIIAKSSAIDRRVSITTVSTNIIEARSIANK
jgi:hypothetical protein